MDRSPYKSPEDKNGGPLKTTTWGALIASSILVAGLGLTGYLSHLAVSPQVIETADNSALNQTAASPSTGGISRSAGLDNRSSSSASILRPTLEVRKNGTVAVQSAAQANGSPAILKAPVVGQKEQGGAQQNAIAGEGSTGVVDAQAQLAAKIAPDLQGIDPEKPVDVIVQYKSSAAASDLTAEGATVKSELPLVHAQLVTVQGANLSNVAAHSEVAYISPNRAVRSAMDPVVTAVNADIAYNNGWDGTGVGVAVLDSGVSNVPDLNYDGNVTPNRIVYAQSFVPGLTSTGDYYGHGTHVAGIVAGNGYSSTTQQTYPNVYRGIAPEATIINLRVLDSNGAGVDSSVISAIQQAIALKNTYNIRVINLSLSRGIYESYTLDPLCQAVESAWKAGIVVVAAAGNMGEYYAAGTQGYATIGAPGNDPYVITVGATNTHGSGSQASQTMTSYSSKGPTALDHIVKPDLVAPGNAVISNRASSNITLLSLYPTIVVYPCNASRSSCGSQYGTPQYMQMSGTSMATPVVSGVVALLVQKTPSLTRGGDVPSPTSPRSR